MPSIVVDVDGEKPSYFNFDYWYCEREHRVMRYIPADLYDTFCQQTHYRRIELEKAAYGLCGETLAK